MASRRIQLQFQGARLDTEVAESLWRLTLGLMFRRPLPDDAALLLAFPHDADWGIHMWFVRCPLDLVFLGHDGRVARIASARPWAWGLRAGEPVRYVLEAPFGWCARNGLRHENHVDLSPLTAASMLAGR